MQPYHVLFKTYEPSAVWVIAQRLDQPSCAPCVLQKAPSVSSQAHGIFWAQVPPLQTVLTPSLVQLSEPSIKQGLLSPSWSTHD